MFTENYAGGFGSRIQNPLALRRPHGLRAPYLVSGQISATYDTQSQQNELLEPAKDQMTCKKAGEKMEAEHNITSDPEAPSTGHFDEANPFAPLQLLPEFKNEPLKRQKKKSRPKGVHLQRLSSDDLCKLYLEKQLAETRSHDSSSNFSSLQPSNTLKPRKTTPAAN